MPIVDRKKVPSLNTKRLSLAGGNVDGRIADTTYRRSSSISIDSDHNRQKQRGTTIITNNPVGGGRRMYEDEYRSQGHHQLVATVSVWLDASSN
jgi:hypothetical protein